MENELGHIQPFIMMLNTDGEKGMCMCVFMYVCVSKFETCLVHYATHYASGHIKWACVSFIYGFHFYWRVLI